MLMLQPQRTTARRLAFTLVEMLVVIAIIAVLIALVAPAVFGYLKKGPQVRVANDLAQLDTAIQNFKTTMGPKYIPSRIKLCEKFGQYVVIENGYTAAQENPLDRASVDYLTNLFQKIRANNTASLWDTRGIDWNGNGVYTDAPIILEGHQCLVFFLGGIPVNNPAGVSGFSTNQSDPAQPGGGRKGPFYDGFTSDRLVDLTSTAANGSATKGYYSLLDRYDKNKPYAYFSSYNARNGYPKWIAAVPAANTPPSLLDNASLGVNPYCEAVGRYWNPEGHQIICAGADGTFGPGGVWTKANPISSGPGQDDQTNFNGGNLMLSGG
jgi:general secretion pathway protein G